ncbi:Rab35 [Symbiodinium natans]|uniref:Rab35 protein n=1 Tax=Symbiodinium natans TaxID=878477 RepID=A0A812N0I4_9DINO|nr:Rab35 [Symbiodinium natans]
MEMDCDCRDEGPFVMELRDRQVVRLVNSSTLQPSPLIFRAYQASPQQLVNMKADPALEAFHLEILDGVPAVGCLKWAPQPQTCLRILPNRSVDRKGGRGPWATFAIAARDAAGIALRSLGHGTEQPAYLAANTDNGFVATTSLQDPSSRWLFQPEHVASPFDSFDLTEHEYDTFARDGFVIVKGAVPNERVEDALRCINNLLGKGPAAWVVDPDAPTAPGEAPTHKLPPLGHPSIMELVSHTCLGAAVQRLLRGLPVQPGAGQLAVRFPVTDRLESFGDGVLTDAAYRVVHRDDSTQQFHIDGMGKESPLPFSLLCKIGLSDQTSQHCGNFTIFPGSHRNPDVIRWFFAHLSGNEGTAPKPPRPEVGEPLQVRLAPGDAVLVHPYLCHRVGTNTSPNVRYSVIFRFRTRDIAEHAADQEALVQNPMLDFPWFSRGGNACAEDAEAQKAKQQKTSS